MIDRIARMLGYAPAKRGPYHDATVTLQELASKQFTRNDDGQYVSRAVSSVWHAASLIGRNVPELDFCLYEAGGFQLPGRRVVKPGEARRIVSTVRAMPDDDEIVAVEDHPALDLLHDPNPYMTGDMLTELQATYLELTGNAYYYVVRGSSGVPVELWPMHPGYTVVQPGRDEFVEGYWYGRERSKVTWFEPDEVIHVSKARLHSPYYGVSWLQAMLLEVDTNEQIMQHLGASYQNNARPALVAVLEGATPEQREQFEKSWNSKFRGARNAGKLAVMSSSGQNGITLQEVGFTPEMMQLIDTLDFSRDDIMSKAGVPKSIYSTDDVNLANAREGELTFERRTLLPAGKILASGWNRLLEMFGETAGEKWFGVVGTDATDAKEVADRVTVLVREGILTPNEARRELGYDDVEGADELRDTSQPDPLAGAFGFKSAVADSFLSLGERADQIEYQNPEKHEPAKELKVGAPANETNESQDRSIEIDPIDHRAWLFGDDECRCGDGENGDSGDALTLARAVYARETREIPRDPESQFVSEVASFLRAQADSIAAWVGTNPTQADRFSLNRLVVPRSVGHTRDNRDDWDALLTDILERYTTPEIADAASEAIEAVGEVTTTAGLSFDLEDERAVEFLRRYRLRLSQAAGVINQQTEKAVREAIRRGVSDGQSVNAIAEELSTRFAQVNPERALRVARTETSRARGAAVEAGWEQTGVVSGKRWSAAPNECEFCRVMDGREAAIGEVFVPQGTSLRGAEGGTLNLNYEDVRSHPLHPNCRCSVEAIINEGDDA